MSAVERIQQELARQKAAARNQRDQAKSDEYQRLLARQQEEYRQQQETVARIQRNRSIAEPVFRESRVLEELRAVEDKFLRKYRRHGVFTSWTYSATATLAWGESFTVGEDGYIGFEKHIQLGDLLEGKIVGYKNYQDISVSVDVDHADSLGDLIFSGAGRLTIADWRRDHSLVSKHIADSFLNPSKTFDTDEPSPPSGTSGTGF